MPQSHYKRAPWTVSRGGFPAHDAQGTHNVAQNAPMVCPDRTWSAQFCPVGATILNMSKIFVLAVPSEQSVLIHRPGCRFDLHWLPRPPIRSTYVVISFPRRLARHCYSAAPGLVENTRSKANLHSSLLTAPTEHPGHRGGRPERLSMPLRTVATQGTQTNGESYWNFRRGFQFAQTAQGALGPCDWGINNSSSWPFNFLNWILTKIWNWTTAICFISNETTDGVKVLGLFFGCESIF